MTKERPGTVSDALGLPLIAYRGLWDKFARPSTPGAVRRSYQRGVPSLVRCVEPADIADILELAADPAVNRRRQPVYFLVTQPPSLAIGVPSTASSIACFSIDASGSSDQTWPIHQLRNEAWVPAGCYVPIGAARRGLTGEDLGTAGDKGSTILFESVNVLDDIGVFSELSGLDDDDVCAAIRALAGASAALARVSDLVELDLLILRIREAA